jgi:hypothetical protein
MQNARGKTPHSALRIPHLGALLLAAIALGAGWLAYQASIPFHLRRLDVVKEGMLYRSGQPTAAGIAHLADQRVTTVVSLRREDAPLRFGLCDVLEDNGPRESIFVNRIGARHQHWPMGRTAFWPFFSGKQFEQFFKLIDDPANFPLAVHCIGGRHRTGTFVALYRMEYDRWDVERTMREMYSFEFGAPVPVQEHNLRTYLPRPLPSPEQWTSLLAALGHLLGQPADYATFVRRLRGARGNATVEAALTAYLEDARPFALCLAPRVIDTPDDPCAPLACDLAAACLCEPDAPAVDWAIAAAFVADFGDPGQQQALLNILENKPRRGPPSARYQAVVRGVTNRYTSNRIAFLKPLLLDERARAEPEAVLEIAGRRRRSRYCDTAVARLCTILDLYCVMGPGSWDECGAQFIAWFDQHPAGSRPVRLDQSAIDLPRPRDAGVEDRDDFRR